MYETTSLFLSLLFFDSFLFLFLFLLLLLMTSCYTYQLLLLFFSYASPYERCQKKKKKCRCSFTYSPAVLLFFFFNCCCTGLGDLFFFLKLQRTIKRVFLATLKKKKKEQLLSLAFLFFLSHSTLNTHSFFVCFCFLRFPVFLLLSLSLIVVNFFVVLLSRQLPTRTSFATSAFFLFVCFHFFFFLSTYTYI